jgi:hypothetical protein
LSLGLGEHHHTEVSSSGDYRQRRSAKDVPQPRPQIEVFQKARHCATLLVLNDIKPRSAPEGTNHLPENCY